MSEAAAGWYPDPQVPGQQRYWDGTKWTDHVAPAAPSMPAGWYADPQDAKQRRYWDGTQWTEHVAAAATSSSNAAGWYPDPQDESQQRYWDGTAWTESVRRPPLIEGDLKRYMSGKTDRIFLTEELLEKNDQRIALTDVTAVAYGVTQISGGAMHGSRDLFFSAATPQSRIDIHLGSHARRVAQAEERAYQVLVAVAQQLIEPRLIKARVARIASGEAVQVGKLVLTRTGVGDGKKHQIPWPQLASFNVTNVHVELYAHQPDGSVKLDFKTGRGGPDVNLLPTMLKECAARFREG
jgi:hypothetical protein